MGLYRIEDSDRIYSAKVPNLGRCVRADHDAEHDIILLYRTTLVNSGAKLLFGAYKWAACSASVNRF